MFILKAVFFIYIWKSADSSNSKTVFSCENNELNLSCEEGQVIHIIQANYGRLTRTLCNDDSAVQWSGEHCMANNSFSTMNDRCEEKRKCTVKATNSIFGDPCSGTIKYLEVQHTCVPRDTSKSTTEFSCENNELNLSCEEGLVIHIIRANFGRLNRNLCNDDGKVQWSGEDCMANNSFSILIYRCEHKQKCTVKASNSIFGDPCGGTIKYLEVEHTCVPADRSKTKTVYSCENTELNLGCEDGRVLQIIRANYGRSAREFCNYDGLVWWPGEDCIANNSYPTVRDRCEQKQRCTIRASNSNFGDPCHGTIKYLEVQYTCAPKNISMNPPDNGFECPKLSEKWYDFDGEYCYFIETINKLNWYEASFECMRRGGSLASIHSEKESLMIHQFVRDTEYSLFIGLIRLMTDENMFVWSDGSAMDYQNWNANEPNWMDEKCGEVLTGNMKWNDVMCHNTLGYICSVRKVSPGVTECSTECNCPTSSPCDCPTSPKMTEISTQCDCPTLSNRTENLNHIDCPNGISYEIVISVAVCILLAVVLIGTGISCFRYRRQRRNRSSSTVRIQPPVPSSHRPIYFTASDPFTKDENNYYEHMN